MMCSYNESIQNRSSGVLV